MPKTTAQTDWYAVARIQFTTEVAHAAGHDAGNRSMHAAGRFRWSTDDWNAAVKEFDRILPFGAKAERRG